MATSNITYPSTKERVNYVRICRVIVDLSTDVFRDILSTLAVPNQLRIKVQNCADFRKRLLSAVEQHKINSAVTNSSYGEFDISFLYKLIQAISVQELRFELNTMIPASNIWTAVQNDKTLMLLLNKEQEAKVKYSSSNKDYSECDCYLLTLLLSKLTSTPIPHIIPTVNKWGGNSLPSPSDIKLGDDIERIRLLRNKVYGHVSDTCVTDGEFQTHWNVLTDIMQRMDQELKTGGRYSKDLNDIEKTSLDDKWNDYVSEIEKLAEAEEEFKDRLEKQELSIFQLQKNVTSINQNDKETKDKIEKQERASEKLQTEVISLNKSEKEFQDALETHEKSAERLQTEVVALNKNEKEIKANLEKQNRSIEQLKTDVTSINQNDKETKDKMEKQERASEKLQTEVISLNKSEQETQDALETHEKSAKRLQTEVVTLNKNKKEMKAYVEKQKQSIEQLQTDITSLNKDISKISLQVDGVGSELVKQKHSTKEMRAKVTSLGTVVKNTVPEIYNGVPINIQIQNEQVTGFWETEDRKFIETRATKNILDYIDKNNILTVTGNAGCGKSASIRHVALALKEKGYDILEVHNPSEIITYLNPNGRQVFVIDDPVGVHGLDRQKFSFWVTYNDRLSLCLSKCDVKFLCSIRKQVVNEPEFVNGKSILNRNVISLQDEQCSLNEKEKMQILQQHLKANECDVQILKNIKLVLKHTLAHFPLVCELFSSSKEFQKYGLEFFKSPFSVVLKDLDAMKREDKKKYCTLIMCFINENLLDSHRFDPFNSTGVEKKIDSVMKVCGVNENEFLGSLGDNIISLSGVYFRHEGSIYQFVHDLIHDVVAFHFGQHYPSQMIKLSSSRFICERVTVCDTVVNNDPYVIKLGQDYFLMLLNRLIGDLDREEYIDAIMNKCWDNKLFMDVFLEKFVKDKENILKLFCRKITETKGFSRNMLQIKEDVEYFMQHDAKKTWSLHIIVADLLQVPNITPIHIILIYSHKSLFKLLWKNFTSEEREIVVSDVSLLHYACLGGDVETCNIVLQDTKCNIDIPCFYQRSIFGNDHMCEYFPLHLATMKSCDLTKFLLSKGANIEVANKSGEFTGRTAITWASGFGNIDIVSLLISEGADVNVIESPLYYAAMTNRIDIIKLLLLNRNVNVNRRNSTGMTALMTASDYGRYEVVQLLLNHGVIVDTTDKDGFSALMCASLFGHNETVQLLLSHGSLVDIKTNDGDTSLMLASGNGHNEVVKLLLGHGASVETRGTSGWTALMVASINGHNQVVQLLLSHGASVDTQNDDGQTSLMLASTNGHSEVVQLLLYHGASVEIQDSDGWTSALLLASGNGHNKVVQLLLGHGTSVDKGNCFGQTALLSASENGLYEVLQTLLGYGASVDIQNDVDEKTALILASENGHNEVVQLLLGHGASVDIETCFGQTALLLASESGHKETVQLLLDHGASVDIQNCSGQTALMLASAHGHYEVVKLLLGHGANVDIHSCIGWTALYLASGHSEVVQLLLGHGASADI